MEVRWGGMGQNQIGASGAMGSGWDGVGVGWQGWGAGGEPRFVGWDGEQWGCWGSNGAGIWGWEGAVG